MRNINRRSKSDAMSQTVRSDPSSNNDSRINIAWAYGAAVIKWIPTEIFLSRHRGRSVMLCQALISPTALHGMLLNTEGNHNFQRKKCPCPVKILTEYGSIKIKKYHYDGCRSLTSCVYGITEGDRRCTSLCTRNGPPCSNSSLLLEHVLLPIT